MNTKKKLAIFDLDNTLLQGDSDNLWGQFMIEKGLVDGEHYGAENKRFYDEYCAGTLDIYEFLRFALKPLSEHSMATLKELHLEYMEKKILPIISDTARDLLDAHRDNGRFLLIITATNRFITQPIAEELGVDALLATEPEIKNNRYTGRVSGVPCFQAGKVERLKIWLQETGHHLAESWFYSDSHNDLPLLELVTYPVAVDPDDTLASHAEAKQWPIISLVDSVPADS